MLADEIIILVHCKREGSERKFRGWWHWACLQRIQGWDGIIAAVVDDCRQWRTFRRLMSIRVPFALGMMSLYVQQLATGSCRLVNVSHQRKVFR